MHLPTVRPLVAIAATGAALALLAGCGSGSSPAAAATTPPAAVGSASGSASPGVPAPTPSEAAGGSGGSGQSGTGGVPLTRPSGAATVTVKPCSLVSLGEAAAALQPTQALTQKINSAAECQYASAAGDTVDLEVKAVPFTPDLPNAMTEVLPPAQVKRIDGLGDAALLFTPTLNLAQFYLWKHGLYIVIIVGRAGAGSVSSAATSLGQMVAGRI